MLVSFQWLCSRARLVLVVLPFLTLGLVDSVIAETWSDTTGEFRIDATYVGVEGKSVVLKKADGKQIKVPISKLSAESRALAKSLYDQSKRLAPSESSNATASAASGSGPLVASRPLLSINFSAPVPPPVPPARPFPEDASLQETVDFLIDETLAGHPEVFWSALPESVREALDEAEALHKAVNLLQKQNELLPDNTPLTVQVLEILITKKEYILGSGMLQSIPPPFLESVRTGYDPAVGLLYEYTAMLTAAKNSQDQTVTQQANFFGPRMGGHLRGLFQAVPDGMIPGLRSMVQVDETGSSSGTITVPSGSMGENVIEMERYQGRWVPAELAQGLRDTEGNLKEQITASLDEVHEDMERKERENEPRERMLATPFESILRESFDDLKEADNQQDFDRAIGGLMANAMGSR